MTFSEKLKRAREVADLSQKDLSKKSGVSQQAIAAYELGTRTPNWSAVQSLAAALGISCLELTDDPKSGKSKRSS